MVRSTLVLLVFALTVTLSNSRSRELAHAKVCGYALYSVHENSDLVWLHAPDGHASELVPILVAGETVTGATGLAYDEGTDQVWILLNLEGAASSTLGTIDLQTGEAAVIGTTGFSLSDLTFAGTVLYAMTDQDETPAETLFEIDLATGDATMVCALGRGDVGEAIAWDPVNEVLYHASGSAGPYDPITDSGVIFETVDAGDCTWSDIPIDTLLTGDVVSSIAHNPDGYLIWKQGDAEGPLYCLLPDGTIFDETYSDVAITDMAFVFDCPPPSGFRRGDTNLDALYNIGDAIHLLNGLFTPSGILECMDAADANDDGNADIGDAVFILSSLFVPGSPLPPAPGPYECGPDWTDFDTLDCGTGCDP